ncbi:MAG TPA: hypothetical protein PKE00_15785 [Planctomycetota bacterium]|nr:hypothetical protein [Planctomycetota bacterium]
MKIIISVFVVLALAMAGFVGFIVFDASPSEQSDATSAVVGDVGAKVATISRGERVEFSDHVTPGVLTVFDFTADW